MSYQECSETKRGGTLPKPTLLRKGQRPKGRRRTRPPISFEEVIVALYLTLISETERKKQVKEV